MSSLDMVVWGRQSWIAVIMCLQIYVVLIILSHPVTAVHLAALSPAIVCSDVLLLIAGFCNLHSLFSYCYMQYCPAEWTTEG